MEVRTRYNSHEFTENQKHLLTLMGQGFDLVTDLTAIGAARIFENGFGKVGEVENVQLKTISTLRDRGFIVKGKKDTVQHWELSAEMQCRFGRAK